MISKPSQYVCLASYNCPCHPTGKPVSESTMKRHRASANRTRSEQGLPLLGRGPIYSASASGLQYNIRHNHAFTEYLTTGIENSAWKNGGPADIFAQRGSSSPDDPSLPPDEHMVAHRLQTDVGNVTTTVEDEAASQMIAAPVTIGGEFLSPIYSSRTGDIIDSSNNGESDGSEEESRQNEIVLDDIRSISLSSDYVTEDDCTSSEPEIGSDEESAQRLRANRAAAELRFRDWARESQPWIKLYVDYSLRGNVMSEILSLIKAPISLVTVKRNLQKYSKFTTDIYLTCERHRLIGKQGSLSDASEEDEPDCDQCNLTGSQPVWNTFEYLPILPRVTAWLRDERSCRTIYDYLHGRLSSMIIFDDAPEHFEDFFDGDLFRRIAANHGGIDGIKSDIFLGISCDGFQTFRNESYESWPIVAIVLNLPPSMRFLMKNILPLGFVKGPRKPSLLDTFFAPLMDEISVVNEGGGTTVNRWDGTSIKIRVHIVFITADGPASQLLSGAVGGNGKAACRLCLFHGYYCTISRHYYYPSQIPLLLDGPSGSSGTQIMYDIDNPPMRSQSQIEKTLTALENSSFMRQGERERLRRDTGIKRRTVLLRIPNVIPYESFPLDTMHLFMNLTKDLLELLRGENARLISRGYSDDDFVISTESWKMIDAEMDKIPGGTSLDAFGSPPTTTSTYSKWKAIECRDFLLYYALVLLDGHLPSQYLKGLASLCKVVRLSSKPFISKDELDELDSEAKAFVKHFEERYYKHDLNRVFLCKSTLHALVHLKRTVQLCGPLLGCNQFWVERFIGYKKEKMHAKNLPAESLTEICKLSESYKLFYKSHFEVNKEDRSCISQSMDGEQDEMEFDVSLKPPCDYEKLDNSFHSRMNTRGLLVSYLKGTERLSEEEATAAVQSSEILCYGSIEIRSGNGSQTIGASKARRHRKRLKRADHFVSAEFESREEMKRDVYYGRIQKVFRYEFSLSSGTSLRTLVLMDWANRLQLNAVGEIFKSTPLQTCFTNPSVESCKVVLNSIGVVEHKIPGVRNRRTYFFDPQRETYCLLKLGKASPDNIDRNLQGFIPRFALSNNADNCAQ